MMNDRICLFRRYNGDSIGEPQRLLELCKS